jgi:urate oxidase
MAKAGSERRDVDQDTAGECQLRVAKYSRVAAAHTGVIRLKSTAAVAVFTVPPISTLPGHHERVYSLYLETKWIFGLTRLFYRTQSVRLATTR